MSIKTYHIKVVLTDMVLKKGNLTITFLLKITIPKFSQGHKIINNWVNPKTTIFAIPIIIAFS